MPVIDHPVHPSTVAGKFYGCNNRAPHKDHYFATDRLYATDGTFVDTIVKVNHVMSTDCRYDQPNDPRCMGCIWKIKTVDI